METFFTIFGMSFVIALLGALQPGPLLAYTIESALDAPRRGWLAGPKVVIGHAALELSLVIALLYIVGLADFLKQPLTVRIVGVMGSAFLLFLAALTLRDVFVKKIELPGAGHTMCRRRGLLSNPILGGAVISMSNAFWWIWWAMMGLAFIGQYNITLSDPLLFSAFFLGHESADAGWYSFVSIAAHSGRRRLSRTAYHVILLATAALTGGVAVVILVKAFLYEA